MPHAIESPTSKPIAIVGIAFRGPGDAHDPEAFYRMLVEGRSARSEIPKDRYNVDAFYHPDPERLGSIQQRLAQHNSNPDLTSEQS
jgi:acyl transferase domain-containing protein